MVDFINVRFVKQIFSFGTDFTSINLVKFKI